MLLLVACTRSLCVPIWDGLWVLHASHAVFLHAIPQECLKLPTHMQITNAYILIANSLPQIYSILLKTPCHHQRVRVPCADDDAFPADEDRYSQHSSSHAAAQQGTPTVKPAPLQQPFNSSQNLTHQQTVLPKPLYGDTHNPLGEAKQDFDRWLAGVDAHPEYANHVQLDGSRKSTRAK